MEACWRTGRRFVGSDDRPDCLDVARRRFAEMQMQATAAETTTATET